LTQVTIQNLMDLLPEFFLPDKALDTQALIVFDLEGDHGGEWTVTIGGGQCIVAEGMGGQADLTLKANAQDVLDLFSGNTDPMRAYLSGKLHLDGNMGLAMRLTQLFHVDKERLKSMRSG
jgi:putative sterol carrier protein